jgi:hypothetical protein
MVGHVAHRSVIPGRLRPHRQQRRRGRGFLLLGDPLVSLPDQVQSVNAAVAAADPMRAKRVVQRVEAVGADSSPQQN